MKPVVIFRHALTEGAGYLSSFLEARSIPWQLVKIDQGDAIPSEVQEFSGLVFMGGPMSVNDDIPWIAQALALIRAAVAQDIPVLGHCLGGQLISKALGAQVKANPVKEIGWGEVHLSDSPLAKQWFGHHARFESFHWHGETFDLPQGATHLLASAHCSNQAYVIGKHLAMQCHIEMTVSMVKKWCEAGAQEVIDSAHCISVQPVALMQEGLESKIAQLNQVAEFVYSQWIKGLR